MMFTKKQSSLAIKNYYGQSKIQGGATNSSGQWWSLHLCSATIAFSLSMLAPVRSATWTGIKLKMVFEPENAACLLKNMQFTFSLFFKNTKVGIAVTCNEQLMEPRSVVQDHWIKFV